MQIELDEKTVNRLLEQALNPVVSATLDSSGFVGKNVFIRTVTFHYTGKLISEGSTWLVLEDAAWIADSGRFSVALKTGTLNEVEPYPNSQIRISIGSIVDMCEWTNELPREQK